jgi:hypothetical protein
MHTVPSPERLAEVLQQVWASLAEGAASRQSPFHQGVFASVSEHGPETRYLVLRRAVAELGVLNFHTDSRSPKCSQLDRDPRASWCFFAEGVQLRCSGRAAVQREGDAVDSAWERTGGFSRRSYLVESEPGAELDGPGSGLSEDILARPPSLEAGEPGRVHFAVVELSVERIDWLHLAHSGHRRAGFERSNGWRGRWLQP